MTARTHYLAAVAAIGALSAPAHAQYAQQYQQPYQQGYGYQPGYGYNQGYAQNPVGQIIDQLLGNRYNVTDRQAVSRCANAAMTQAAAQYGYGNGYRNGYGNGYGNSHDRGYSNLRVTAITDVQRRTGGLRVKGLMSSSGGYGGQYGYQNRAYSGGQLTFRCNVDYRGSVTGVRISRNEYGR